MFKSTKLFCRFLICFFISAVFMQTFPAYLGYLHVLWLGSFALWNWSDTCNLFKNVFGDVDIKTSIKEVLSDEELKR